MDCVGTYFTHARAQTCDNIQKKGRINRIPFFLIHFYQNKSQNGRFLGLYARRRWSSWFGLFVFQIVFLVTKRIGGHTN